MSEAPTTTTAVPVTPAPVTAPATEGAAGTPPAASPAPSPEAASLYPDGGAAPVPPAGAEAAPIPEGGGAESAPAGADTATAPAAIDPASYTFTFPEGFQADDALMTEARATMAESGVSVENAPKLMGLFVKALQNAQTSQETAFQAIQTEWLTSINAMPEFQGATRETSLQSIGRVIDEYGPRLREVFNNPVVGNNPAVAQFMLNVAKALGEGTPSVAPKGPPTQPKGRRSLGQRLYLDQPN